MKRGARIGGAVIVLLAGCWLVRAAWIYRVWQIAHTWCPGGAAPRFAPCLSPDADSFLAQGVWADVAMVRVPLPPAQTARETDALLWSVAQGKGDTRPLPRPASHPPRCNDPQTMRLNPRAMPVADWAPCYGVVGRFGQGAASRGQLVYWTGGRGGAEVLDTGANRLCLMAYRTR